MRSSSCAIDSSCVIALDHARLVPWLSVLFTRVLVPKSVRKELFKRRVTKDRLQAIFGDYAFFERCDGYDQGAVDILLMERHRRGFRDRGEVETVVQASQFGAPAIIDDLWGRHLAERFGLDCHGTLWVLERLYDMRLVSSSQLRESLRIMRDLGIRLPWDVVDSLLARIGEQPLSV